MIRVLFITKRRLVLASKESFRYFSKCAQKIFTLLLSKRQILFVTNQKIKTVNLGPLPQICILVLISWIISLFYSSIQYNKIISQKSEEISRLESVTSYYDTEFDNLNDKLSKVSEYMSSVIPVQKDPKNQKNEKHSFKLPKAIQSIKISRNDQEVLDKMKFAALEMQKINNLANRRLKKIEETLSKTGIKLKNSDFNIASSHQKDNNINHGQGGPYIPLQNFSAQELAMKNLLDFKILDTAKFTDKIKRLISLERMARFMPFSRPMKNEYISSSFGPRSDPLTKKMAMHQGVDFVGSKKQKVISPSVGTVIKAGEFYDYGNIVILDHGYGITSRYGHLSKVLVKKGQLVTQGEVLGIQGSTGRSTGEHLHYEVRHNNDPLNPYNFIKAGDKFFKNNKLEAVLDLKNKETNIKVNL